MLFMRSRAVRRRRRRIGNRGASRGQGKTIGGGFAGSAPVFGFRQAVADRKLKGPETEGKSDIIHIQ